MPVTIKNRQWDVDGGGVACLITPGIPSQTVEQCTSERMDKEIARQTARKDQISIRLAAVQAEFDELSTIVTDLIALRATVTAEP